jgi:hypothetical protein
MKQYTSEAAKSLITIIGTEYAMGEHRVECNFIRRDQLIGSVLARLNVMASNNVDLRLFLDRGAFIPDADDESPDRPWAEDPREESNYVMAQR